MQIPEPNITAKDMKRLKKPGDIEYSRAYFFRRGVWMVCIGKGKLQCFEDYEHAVLFAEIIKIQLNKHRRIKS